MAKHKGLIVIIFLTGVLLSAHPVFSSENRTEGNTFNNTESLIILLKEKEIITNETAQILLEQSDRKLSVEEKESLLKKMKEYETNKPAWFNKLKLSGDFRLRYQADYFDPNNDVLGMPDSPDDVMNTLEDRERVRIRMRLGLIAQVNEHMEIGLRLTTGNEKDPVSTNETMGDYFNKDGIVFERAYLRWILHRRLALYFGRMPNLFDSTDLVWDSDINLEGLTLDFNKLSTQMREKWNVFATAGLFPLQEVELSSRDKWLYGGQVGVKYNPGSIMGFKCAIAYYDYQNIEGEYNNPGQPPNFTNPSFQQKGNHLFDINNIIRLTGEETERKFALVSDFNQLNINGSFDLAVPLSPVHFQIITDWVKNVGFDKEEIKKRVGWDFPEETEGYQVGLSIGHPIVKELWQWNFSTFFKRLESDAVVDAFTDSDFLLGGTNAKGWITKIQLGIANNAWLELNWLTADNLTGDYELAVDVLQISMNAGF